MDADLIALVHQRVDTDDSLDTEAGLVVLAACDDDATLMAAIAGHAPDRGEAPDAGATVEPSGAYLSSVEVEGFRGIGDARTLELAPGPGLTLVVGRNGSGKSSFVEGLEVLLTGDSNRWSNRHEKAAWREGWRNLHHPDPTRVEAVFALDGVAAPTTVRADWAADADLDAAVVSAQTHGTPKSTLASLGWDAAVANHRPILSYNELGSILDEGRAALHDALAGILGLDDLAAAVARPLWWQRWPGRDAEDAVVRAH